jgi:hypothetical protein
MSKGPNSCTDYVFLCMRDGRWWTIWKIQEEIEINPSSRRHYMETAISASIRNLRKPHYRKRYRINGSIQDPVQTRPIPNSKSLEYRLLGGPYE